MRNIDFSHGGDIYGIRRKGAGSIIDFSSNINPLGLPHSAKKAASGNIDAITRYPDIESRALKAGIADYWDISPENILCGNGSAELIYSLIEAYRPKIVHMPAPTFSEYERASSVVGSKVRFIRLREAEGFNLKNTDFRALKTVVMCNPNNPTGNLLIKNRKIGLPQDLLIVDEAFMDFLPDEPRHTLIPRVVRDKRTIVIRTFTKFFAMPGLRLGYLVAHRDTINRIRSFMPPWNVNCMAETAALSILKDKKYIRLSRQFIEEEKDYLYDRITDIEGLRPYPPAANFILIKIEKKGFMSAVFAERLLKKGILIRDCANFRNLSGNFIRMAVRSRNENQKLIEEMKEILR
ncbi:MAG: threonine-phosphate decarboxylase CobD [Candidatus Omnitrophica bacterium]|nr:threonine-phosphate decarboxylase CobD [Candidatus Omnitrophota bacterium]